MLFRSRQALRYPSTHTPCQIPIFNPLKVYKYGLLCVCSKMDTLCDKMSKCCTLYHDSDQQYACRQALRYPSTHTPCQIPILNPLKVYKYGLLRVCSKMDTLCVTCQNVKMWDALSRFGPEICMQASFTLSEHSYTLPNTHIQPLQGLQVWPLAGL